MPPRFYVETYGCRVNQSESEALIEGWKQAGYELVSTPELADYIVVNSCAITRRAEGDARNALNRLRRAAPSAQLILTGCAAQFYAAFTPRKHAPWTAPDLCIPQERKSSLFTGPDASAPGNDFSTMSQSCRARPVVKVQDGCTHRCTYCIVPQTRGAPRSRPVADTLSQCLALARQGFGELVISGINLRQYQGDFWDDLLWLDEQLSSILTPPPRLRLSSLDPSMLKGDALDALSKCRLVCPHVHLSLQHGSPAILRAMGRSHYDLCEVVEAVQRLGTRWPTLGLGADIIVGFPGEEESHMEALLGMVERLPLTYAHVFPYSPRPGTKAAALSGQIARRVKMERAARVRALVASKAAAFFHRALALDAVTMVAERLEGTTWLGVNEYFNQCLMEGRAVSRGTLLVGKPVAVEAGKLLLHPLPAAP